MIEKKMNTTSVTCGGISSGLTCVYSGSQKERREETEKIFEETAPDFPNVMKN